DAEPRARRDTDRDESGPQAPQPVHGVHWSSSASASASASAEASIGAAGWSSAVVTSAGKRPVYASSFKWTTNEVSKLPSTGSIDELGTCTSTKPSTPASASCTSGTERNVALRTVN